MIKPLNKASATPGSSSSTSCLDRSTAFLSDELKSTTAMITCYFIRSNTFWDSDAASCTGRMDFLFTKNCMFIALFISSMLKLKIVPS